MTKEMVIESIGKPDDINRTVGSWGVHEQWVYDKRGLYIYFKNGKVTSFQDWLCKLNCVRFYFYS